MAISYKDAVQTLKSIAEVKSAFLPDVEEEIAIDQSVGRITARQITSHVSTPAFDTSAMDGFAIRSELTAAASVHNPATFCVKGAIAAGDTPTVIAEEEEGGFATCTEIMTGARFPHSSRGQFSPDSCVRLEDTISMTKSGARYIQVTKPVPRNANRRFAGSDFRAGDEVIPKGTVIQPHHLLALSSLGIRNVWVWRKLRVGIWSTGKEIQKAAELQYQSHIPDANGPYLIATLKQWGAEPRFLGVLGDDAAEMEGALRKEAKYNRFDILISTGAVSKGKFDFVRPALESCNALIHFHGVAMRPGHPVLCGSVTVAQAFRGSCDQNTSSLVESHQASSITFFGLPGNPIAAAVCLRFLISPYLNFLQGRSNETARPARLKDTTLHQNGHIDCQIEAKRREQFPQGLDIFRHGTVYPENGEFVAEMHPDQSSSKLKPLVSANCWIHLQPDITHQTSGDIVSWVPLSPT